MGWVTSWWHGLRVDAFVNALWTVYFAPRCASVAESSLFLPVLM